MDLLDADVERISSIVSDAEKMAIVLYTEVAEGDILEDELEVSPNVTIAHTLVEEFPSYGTDDAEVSMGGTALSLCDTWRDNGVVYGARVSCKLTSRDTFNAKVCCAGMTLSNNGYTVTKSGGSDLTAVLGSARVSAGSRRWHISIDRFGIRDPNVIIGVVPSDTPVDFVNLMWSSQCELNVRSDNTGELSGKWAYIKCPGNMTAHGWQVCDFEQGDVITVEVDMDDHTVSFSRNGKPMKWNDKLNQEQLQGNQDPKHVLNPEPADGTVRKCRLHYQGPVSLFVNFDYNADAVTIVPAIDCPERDEAIAAAAAEAAEAAQRLRVSSSS